MIPLVEEEYNALTLNYESAKQKYNEILNKLFAANISRQMDVSERGERFEIVEPAHLPEKPYKPNRIAIILFGLVLGLFTALSLAALAGRAGPLG
jgi:succinoglycan biosynthesis transport protein ExoP